MRRLIVLLPLALPLALLLALSPPVFGADSPQAVFAESTFDFGTVRQGETITHAFVVRNTGSAPLLIDRVELSLPGLKARFKHEIPPAGEGKVTIEWATTHVNGEMEAEAVVKTNDPARREATLVLKGTVQAPISVSPLPAVFLSVFKGESAERVLTIESHEERPLTIASIEKQGTRFTAALETDRPGRVYRLRVKVQPDVPAGRYDESLTLVTDSRGRPRIDVPVHLLVKPDVYANPEAVDYGQVPLAKLTASSGAQEFLTQTFLVKRRQGEFRVTSITCDSPAVKLELSPSTASDTFRVDVRLVPGALKLGKLETAIRIETNDPRFPALVVPVRGEVL